MADAASEITSFAVSIEGSKDDVCTLRLAGNVSMENIQQIYTKIMGIPERLSPKRVAVDLSAVAYLDSSGAMALLRLKNLLTEKSVPLEFLYISEEARRIFALIEHEAALKTLPPPVKEPEGFLAAVGDRAAKLYDSFSSLMIFVGDIIANLIYSLRYPARVRWDAVFFYMKRAGVDGLPIVGLISVLMGLIMAFMSSLQLRQFGANIYVASLVAMAIVKELGPMMTAILVAGRSGSAFAAEIGTMMVNEEVDALVTMGYNPTRFLVVPKILACVVIVPILTVYADLIGILGGLFVGITSMDLTLSAYMQQTVKSIRMFDVWSSLIKTVCFSLLISGIVCYRGFQVRGGAEAVGEAATSAVVSAILLIIICDSAFAVMLHYINPHLFLK